MTKVAMPSSVLGVTPQGAAACSLCPRAAAFQARVEVPAGQEHSWRHANACGGHLVEIIEELRAWARDRRIVDGWVTALAIDPDALPRLAGQGVTEHGFAFYTAPLIPAPQARGNEGRPA